MSDKDSAGAGDANQQQPGPANSPVDSQPEAISALEAQIASLSKQVDSLRSNKDKAVVQTNRRLSEFEQKQEELTKLQAALDKYGSPEEAAWRLAMESLLQGEQSLDQEQVVPSQQDVANPEDKAGKSEDNLVALLGVDPEDAEYNKYLSAGNSPNDAAIKVAENRRKRQLQEDPNAASGVAGSGQGGALEGASESALKQDYQERLSKLQQGDWKGISMLKSEFRKKGLDIW
jgi:hypothetical protein